MTRLLARSEVPFLQKWLLSVCLTLALALANGLTGSVRVAAVKLEISWGHQTSESRSFFVRLAGREVNLSEVKPLMAEELDSLRDGVAQTRAGAGDVDGLSCLVQFTPKDIESITNAHSIWNYLFKQGDPGATKRLQADPAYRPDSRMLTIQLNEAGTLGFSVTVDQLLSQKSFWLPELDLFVSAGDPPRSFAAHQLTTERQRGQRVLDRVGREPEATYHQFTSLWEDMGNPSYRNPHSIPPGHIVCLTWDSALYKFGVDRYAGVRNDYAKTDVFYFHYSFSDAAKAWRSQRLADGLPIITTTFEDAGARYEIEQFAAPLLGPPKERRGDIAMLLFQKVIVRELTGTGHTVSVVMQLDRDSAKLREETGAFIVGTAAGDSIAVQGPSLAVHTDGDDKKITAAVTLELPARGMREFYVKLASPLIVAADLKKFLLLDYADVRMEVVQYWNQYLARGAQFEVPEEPVNTLFRANLWHALRLPRRHGGGGPVKIDLPYSNFAYDQVGTPWPVNQSVYVDYMIYDLRGYHDVAAEELEVMFRNHQEANGHVGGFANWGVYTPGMLYSVAQHFLLSGDRGSFERLLPQTLRGLDWCLGEMRQANDSKNPAMGLVLAPLNDLSHEPRSWAFNQAYFVAGVELLGRALAEIHHPRATECAAASQAMRTAVEREFGRASARSPIVQLADATWSLYVPCDAQGSGRLFQSWYPTDVDTGPLHLPRLKALDPRGLLTSAMLHDHEDNLFIHQWGTINEPVYNMQGTTYLLRDEPKAAIRTFYSTMACAFSHSVFEPVEHRWAWGQYFGPPSTDGSWFELYRNMLIHENDEDVLVLAQATPRAWLEDGKRITVQHAPTYFGDVSFVMESHSAVGELTATIDLPDRKPPASMLVRFRHPQAQRMRTVTVNGKTSMDFDPTREWVRIAKPSPGRYVISSKFEPAAQ